MILRRAGLAALLGSVGVACSDYNVERVPNTNNGIDTGPSTIDTGDLYDDVDDGTTGSIRGRICDFSGEGYVVGASVVVTWDSSGDGNDDSSASATTDGEGWFQLDGVPLGEHTLVVRKGSFTVRIDVQLNEPGLLQLAEEECLVQDDVEIAVITGVYDNIGAILHNMELEFDGYNGTSVDGDYLDLLLDFDAMSEYDIIFFNCGITDTWAPYQIEIGENIAQFVEEGGSIYASDWAYYFFEVSFPTMIDFYGDDDVHMAGGAGPEAAVGLAGTVTADVFDANMMAVVGGNTAQLTYDLDAWIVPVSVLSSATPMVRGDARTFSAGVIEDAPLAVKVERNGVAIFTTFHNERQITIDMESLLEEIILNL